MTEEIIFCKEGKVGQCLIKNFEKPDRGTRDITLLTNIATKISGPVK